MFRRQALRASRTAYFASVGVVGTVIAETSNSDDQSTTTDIVPDVLAQTNNLEADQVPSTVMVEPESPKVAFPDLPDKLSIYPKPASMLVLLDTPSPLELQIRQARQQACGYYSDARTQVQGVIDRWIHVEEAVESRLKSFRDPAEPLNPGLLYTGISALTASVIVRSRSLPVRFLFPPLSLVGAFAYFLPHTAGHVGSWVEELETKYVPRVGEVRRTSVLHTSMALGMVGEKYKEGREGIGRGARSIVERIESSTGLRLNAALGWTPKAQETTKTRSDDGGKST